MSTVVKLHEIHWALWRSHRKYCVGFFAGISCEFDVNCAAEKPQRNQIVDLLTVKKNDEYSPTTRTCWMKEETNSNGETMWVWNFHPKAILRASHWTELTPKATVIAAWYSLQIQCKFVVAFPTNHLLITTRNWFGFPMILLIKWSKTKATIKKNDENRRKKLRTAIDIELVDWSKRFFNAVEQ